MKLVRHRIDRGHGDHGETTAEKVLRELVDAALQEDLVVLDPPELDGGWGSVGTLRVRLRDGGALQPWRAVPGSVRDADGRPVTPAAALAALGLSGPGAPGLADDLTAAAEHGAVMREGLADTASFGVGLRAGERWAAARGRPFHPTARAVSGWTVDEVRAFGPMRVAPLPCAWVAVARDHLRLGPDAGSARLHEHVLADGEDERLHDAMARAGVSEQSHQPLPVHPWQHEHVLGQQFAPEMAAGLVVPLEVELGRLHPTSSIRTLVVAGIPRTHLKLPLGVATLGATRLLPPRYLDNGDRAERVLRDVVARDPALTRLVDVCAEGLWAGWSDGTDEFDDRPGHLAAQIRRYPVDPDGAVALLPMGALATGEAWDALGPGLGVDDPLEFFGGLADAFTAMVVGFLSHGVLPEIHGQNVLVRLAPGGAVAGFVLRDHDTLRIHPPWMDAAGVAGPGYRLRPGARQSLRLDDPEALVGYALTLGVQVNLSAIADALSRRHGLPERAFWDRVLDAVEGSLRVGGLRTEVGELVERVVLHAPTWPCRTLVGPLLAQGRSDSVSMPAGLGAVPNPLRPDRGEAGGEAGGEARRRARAATVTRLVNCVLREIGPAPHGPGPVRFHDLAGGRTLVVHVRHHSPSGHHALEEEAHVEEAGTVRGTDHDEVVELLLGIVAAAADAPEHARVESLTRQIADSTARSARYLTADPRPVPTDPAGRTRHAEQSVRLGHPFHPTPKSLELDAALGPGAATLLRRCAPELGASFRLPHLALDPALATEAMDGPGPWLPGAAVAAAPPGWPVVPVHPVQLAHLRARPETARLFADGALVELGEHGGAVYPTSSVRTVGDPDFPTTWKLPLHVRVTNFVRTVPPEHAARAQDASRVVRALRPGWTCPGFGVVVESGWRGARPDAVGEDVAADLTVVFRENPTLAGGAPRVLAGLVEDGPRGEEPELVGEVRASEQDVGGWLRDYLRVSLLPMIDIFARDGVGFEAHLQNSLLITDGGRPVGFRVRDMEGTHVDRDRLPAGLDPASPLVYDGAEAWRRFRYHVVVNQLAGVIGTLGRRLGGESLLWAVVAEALAEVGASGGPAAPWADDLRAGATLPAKANLLSRFTGRGENPVYVALPNPMRAGDAATRSSTMARRETDRC